MFYPGIFILTKTVTFGVSAAVGFTATTETSVLGNPKRKERLLMFSTKEH